MGDEKDDDKSELLLLLRKGERLTALQILFDDLECSEREKWIDAEKTLPDKEGDYLCILDVDKLTRPMDGNPFYHICHFYIEGNCFHHRCVFSEIIYWMPLEAIPYGRRLPKPPEKEVGSIKDEL